MEVEVEVVTRGGTISGTSSIVQLDAWNWEDAVLKVDDGIHLNFRSTIWKWFSYPFLHCIIRYTRHFSGL